MIQPDMIPDEVAFALLDIYTLWLGDTDQARAAIAAAINAWPRMRVDDTYRWLSDVAIILPMEDKNAES